MIIESCLETILDNNPDKTYIRLDDLDKAILGYSNEPTPSLHYGLYAIVSILCERDGMSTEESLEFFYFNIEPLSMLEFGPTFLDEFDEDFDIDPILYP